MRNFKPVTNWYCWSESRECWEFNHREDGWSYEAKPSPKFESQKIWASQLWQRVHELEPKAKKKRAFK